MDTSDKIKSASRESVAAISPDEQTTRTKQRGNVGNRGFLMQVRSPRRFLNFVRGNTPEQNLLAITQRTTKKKPPHQSHSPTSESLPENTSKNDESDKIATLRNAFNSSDLDIAKEILRTPEGQAACRGVLITTIKQKVTDYAYADFIFQAGIELSKTDDNGSTVLHAVMEESKNRVLISLIPLLYTNEDKINLISSQNKQGTTPLHLATFRDHENDLKSKTEAERKKEIQTRKNDNYTTINTLLTHIDQLPKDSQINIYNIKDNKGSTPLHRAAEIGNISAVKCLLEHMKNLDKTDQVNLINILNNDNDNPLHLATKNGHLPIARLLLDYIENLSVDDETKKEFIESRNSENHTPLLTAVSERHLDIAELLLHRGALLEAKNNEGSTPLHIAVLKDNKQAAGLLLANGAAVDAKNNNGSTPLHLAGMERNQPITELLVSKGAPADAQDNNGNTVLHHLVTAENPDVDQPQETSTRRYEIAKFLLQKIPPETFIDVGDNTGRTPLHSATQAQDSTSIKLLLQYNAKIESTDNEQQNPLHLLAASGQGGSQILQLLINKMATLTETTRKEIILTTDKDSATPFLLSIKNNNFEVTELLSESYEKVINQVDNHNSTALHLAIRHGDSEIFNLLLPKSMAMSQKITGLSQLQKSGSDINSQDKDGNTALHLASLSNKHDMADALLKSEATFHPDTANSLVVVSQAISEYDKESNVIIKLLTDKIITLSPMDIATFLNVQLPDPVTSGNTPGSNSRSLVTGDSSSTAPTTEPDDIETEVLDSSENSQCQPSPLRKAIIKGSPAIVEFMSDLCRKVWTIDTGQPETGPASLSINDILTQSGNTSVLHLAIEQDYPDSEARQQIMTTLLDTIHNSPESLKGAGIINQKNSTGSSPMHLAIETKQPDIAEILLTYFNKLSSPDKTTFMKSTNSEGYTPLQLAALNNDMSLAEKILATGAGYVEIDFAEEKSGKTALHLATENGHSDMADLLLRNGANINLPEKMGLSSIHIASEKGDSHTTKILLKHNANINMATENFLYPIHITAKNGDSKMTAFLLDNGANIKSRDENNGFSAMHLAASGGHADTIDTLLKRDPEIAKQIDNNGNIPLHLACQKGQMVAVRKLKNDYQDIAIINNVGDTSLHVAARENETDICKLLVRAFRTEYLSEEKREKDITDIQNHDGEIALHLAASNGDTETTKALANIFCPKNPNIETNNGNTPLIMAIKAKSEGAISAILENKETQASSSNKAGEHTLHLAIANGKDNKIPNIMLKKIDELATSNQKRILFIKDIQSYTVLHTASENNDLNAITWFLNKSPIMSLKEEEALFKSKSIDNSTALHLACTHGHTEAGKLLLKQVDCIISRNKAAKVKLDKNKKTELIHSSNNHGSTPLHLVIKSGKDTKSELAEEIVSRLKQYYKASKLSGKIKELDLMDKDGYTPLHLAAKSGNKKTIKLLLKNGANMDTKDSSGLTPLDLARQNQHTDVCSLLKPKK